MKKCRLLAITMHESQERSQRLTYIFQLKKLTDDNRYGRLRFLLDCESSGKKTADFIYSNPSLSHCYTTPVWMHYAANQTLHFRNPITVCSGGKMMTSTDRDQIDPGRPLEAGNLFSRHCYCNDLH